MLLSFAAIPARAGPRFPRAGPRLAADARRAPSCSLGAGISSTLISQVGRSVVRPRATFEGDKSRSVERYAVICGGGAATAAARCMHAVAVDAMPRGWRPSKEGGD